jgi:hypothetical protein
MTELQAAPRRSERTLAQELNGELVLVQVDTGQYYTLNDVGSRVWELCDGSLTVAQVISQVCDEFDAPPAQVQADVLDLVDTLSSEKLLVTAS